MTSTRYARRGLVCAVDQLAAEAGVAILRAGGNAVDAAIATSAVLTVTTQQMCGLGGDLFALVSQDSRPPLALNASGRAGSGADAERMRTDGLTEMPMIGDIRSVPVPGCVDGWVALHARVARLPLGMLLAPAIDYAQNGFPATPGLAAGVRSLGANPGAKQFGDGVLSPGDLVRRPGVARTLRAIAQDGRDGFYGGEFGQGLGELGAGEYLAADFARVNADWVEPLSAKAFGWALWTVPPNSQGYLTLASAWIAEHVGVPAQTDSLWAHVLIEASRQAAFDRPTVLHENADGAALLDPSLLAPRAAAIDPLHAAALGDAYRAGGTIHLTVVDSDRMGVSLIQSNAAGFGSGLYEPSTGIFLQNRGIGFSLVPGHPAEYGPGKRPPHTLAPALVTTDDLRLDTVLGTMGGDTQPQILLQLLARVLVNGQSAGEAMGASRWALESYSGGGFDTWAQDGRVRVAVESGAPAEWATGLEKRGHDVVHRPYGQGFGFGHAHVIRVKGDVLEGASDPRALSGGACGW